VLLLGGAEGASTTGFRPRGDDACAGSAIKADGASGADTTGSSARGNESFRRPEHERQGVADLVLPA
jgi:hypothetical protein